MPRLHTVLLGGAAALAFASAAAAAPPQWHTTTVDLPDGSKAEIQYVGDIPPKVSVSMPVVQDARPVAIEEVVEEEVSYGGLPRARRIVQAPAMPPMPAIQQPAAPQFVVAGDMPKGATYEYSLITTGTDGKVCTQRTEWKSRGRGKEPEIRRTDRGEGCAPTVAPAQPRAGRIEPSGI